MRGKRKTRWAVAANPGGQGVALY